MFGKDIAEQTLEVQRPRVHCKAAIGGPRPFIRWPIPVQFHPVVVCIAQVESLTHAVVACPSNGIPAAITRWRASASAALVG
jgi:hypothetical protein